MRLSLPNSAVVSVTTVADGPFSLASGGTVSLPEHCRVHGVARPTRASQIHFDLWLPRENWNGKYLQIGQSGFAGTYNPNGLAVFVQRGYAAVYTDAGHRNNNDPDTQGAWALDQPELIVDFGHRSIKAVADAAKAIVRAHYERDARWAYFVGCSDGGREALMAAQRYPDDFHGIVAGAPANHWTHHFAGFAWGIQALHKDPASLLPAAKLPMIQAAAQAACDRLDGVQDEVVDDPRRCHFEPSTLLCKGGDASDCLTAPQVAALEKIRSGPKNPRTGEQIFPGYPLTSIADGEWARWFLASPGGARPVQRTFAEQFFRNFVFDDVRYDILAFDFDKDMARTVGKPVAGEPLSAVIDSYDPDLSRFKARGGKLLQYHGWEDQGIAAEVSTNYYERVIAAQAGAGGNRTAALERTKEFYRLFMVPGMQHCGGGPGPTFFGQIQQGSAVAALLPDADHDIVRALERWVEHGVAPDRIITTKYSDRDRNRVELTRPLCTYPRVARYRGSGSTDDAANFHCVDAR